jgi:hypothetical protein
VEVGRMDDNLVTKQHLDEVMEKHTQMLKTYIDESLKQQDKKFEKRFLDIEGMLTRFAKMFIDELNKSKVELDNRMETGFTELRFGGQPDFGNNRR